MAAMGRIRTTAPAPPRMYPLRLTRNRPYRKTISYLSELPQVAMRSVIRRPRLPVPMHLVKAA
ncbi:hypothetical protein D3C87_870450 [compost metagenome]